MGFELVSHMQVDDPASAQLLEPAPAGVRIEPIQLRGDPIETIGKRFDGWWLEPRLL